MLPACSPVVQPESNGLHESSFVSAGFTDWSSSAACFGVVSGDAFPGHHAGQLLDPFLAARGAGSRRSPGRCPIALSTRKWWSA